MPFFPFKPLTKVFFPLQHTLNLRIGKYSPHSLADIHTTLTFAVSSIFSLYHIPATFRAFSKGFMCALISSKHGFLFVTNAVISLHKVLYHIRNSIHKFLHGILALCYKGKGIFPISGKFWGLHHIRKHRNQLHSVLCGDHLLFLTFHETVLN